MKMSNWNACKRSRQLLEWFPNERSVWSIWFTDEKTFTIATPVNSQNDRFIPLKQRKVKFLKGDLYENVTISAAVSVGESRIGKTSVVFVEPGAKVSSRYYCEHVLRQVYCLQFKLHVVAITGHYSRTELHLTQPEIRSTFFIRRMLTALSQTYGYRTVLI